MNARRMVSWCGFALILVMFACAVPRDWTGALVLALVFFLFMPVS